MWLFYALCFTLFIQAFFLFGPFLRLLQFSKTTNTNLPTSGISIVVCARNELHNLKVLLPLLLEQDYELFEIIIVNDRSDDGSQLWLEEQLANLSTPLLQVVEINDKPENWNGKKFALKKGIGLSKYDTMLLTDADCRPLSKSWISEMASPASAHKEIVLGVSLYEKRAGILNAFIQYETFQTAIQYLSAAIFGQPYMGVGRNLLYQKRVFAESSQFAKTHEVIGGDDDLFISEVANAQNTAICIEPNAQTISTPPLSFKEWYHQKTRHLSVSTHYKWPHKAILGLFHTSWIFYYTLIIILLFNENLFLATLIAISLRTTAIFYIFGQLWKKLNGQTPYHLIVLMDFIYPLYIWFLSPIAMLFKRVKWR